MQKLNRSIFLKSNNNNKHPSKKHVVLQLHCPVTVNTVCVKAQTTGKTTRTFVLS